MASSDICKLWATPLPLRGGGMLPSRILPGPMDGVTEGSFLAAMTARGYVRCWHAPFIRISTGIPRQARINDHLEPYMNQRLPVIAQMMGTNTDFLAGTAKRMLTAGAVCADLNCACPSPTVIGNHSGGARLRDPEWIARTLGAIREAVGERPFSVKLRIGFDSPDEFPRIAAAVRPAAPDIVFLHYRTIREMYRPVQNGWERFLLARECLPDSVLIACGDIQSPQDAVRLAELCPVDGIAAARRDRPFSATLKLPFSDSPPFQRTTSCVFFWTSPRSRAASRRRTTASSSAWPVPCSGRKAMCSNNLRLAKP